MITALQRFEESMRLTTQPRLEQLRQHMDLLARTLQQEAIPAQIAGFMRQRLATLGQQLVQQGPWERLDQLPGNYIPGLSASAWRRPDAFPPAIAADLLAAEAYLRAQTASLRREYLALSQAGLLQRERECIQEAGHGRWTRFEVTAVWRRLSGGCAVDSPVACAVFHALQQAPYNLRVIRSGYSALEADTRLKPHFGMTNGQLKFHLGLIVPRNGGRDAAQAGGRAGGAEALVGGVGEAPSSGSTPCATFTVGGETRAWVEGEVLFFDDSFEHHVNNTCASQRVVFQVRKNLSRFV